MNTSIRIATRRRCIRWCGVGGRRVAACGIAGGCSGSSCVVGRRCGRATGTGASQRLFGVRTDNAGSAEILALLEGRKEVFDGSLYPNLTVEGIDREMLLAVEEENR